MADEVGDRDNATVAVRSQRHRRGHRRGVDLISSLPDEILQHILSFTSMKKTIRTSVLSKRWRHVWSDAPSLFTDWFWFRGNTDLIDEILARYTAPKMTNFLLYTSMDELPYIDTWIEFAMSRNVEKMWLDFYFDVDDDYNFPDFFFINSSVKELSIYIRGGILTIPSCLVSWTSLKKLSLSRCKLSHKCIAKILTGCPVLESLELRSCRELIVLDLSNSPRLKTLEIHHNCWFVTGPTQITAPHIHCLRLKTDQLTRTLVDVSSLIEARLEVHFCSFKKLQDDSLHVMALKMLEKLQNVEKLTFGANFLRILSVAELCCVPVPMFKVKDLTFETKISESVVPGIERVLQNSHELKKLTLHTTTDYHDTIWEEDIDKYLDWKGLNPNQCWSSEARVFKNIHRKNVESKHVASFMELMVKKTKTLEKMVVRLGGDLKGRCFEELLEMVPMLSQDNNVSIVLRK